MKNLDFKSSESKKSRELIFNFIRKSKIEVLKQFQMNQIRGGEGEEGESHSNQEWED